MVVSCQSFKLDQVHIHTRQTQYVYVNICIICDNIYVQHICVCNIFIGNAQHVQYGQTSSEQSQRAANVHYVNVHYFTVMHMNALQAILLLNIKTEQLNLFSLGNSQTEKVCLYLQFMCVCASLVYHTIDSNSLPSHCDHFEKREIEEDIHVLIPKAVFTQMRV